MNDSQSQKVLPGSIVLKIHGIGHIPSKKNCHYPLTNGGVGIDKEIKQRMARLENAILFALYSSCQTDESVTPSECLKRLQMHLSELCDDSVREIPTGSWGVEYVEKGNEGITIEITPI